MINIKKIHYARYNDYSGYVDSIYKIKMVHTLVYDEGYTACGLNVIKKSGKYAQAFTNNYNDVTCKNCKKANK